MTPAPANILVIKLGALGDFIQSLGAMRAIRSHHKDARITLLTTKPFFDLAKNSGYFDDIILDARAKFYQIKKWWAFSDFLNKGKFARVYDLQNNDRTTFYFRLFKKKPEWVGVAKGASHRNISPIRTEGLAFYGHQQTLSLAGIHNVEIDTLEWIKGDQKFEGIKNPYILIVAGSAANRMEKRWPFEHYASLCQKLMDSGFQPVLIGTNEEKNILDEIENRAKGVLNLCGKTSLMDLPSLARGAAAAIGNDTGPMHMIAPTGCKTFVLFSKHSNPHRHAPLGANVKTIQVDDLKNLSPKEVIAQFLESQAL